MFRTRILIATALMAVTVTACGSPIKTGYITDKTYERPWNETVYDETCLGYDKNGFCSNRLRMPRTVHHDATWVFKLREGDQDGWVYVDETTFSRYEVGSHYPDAR